MFVSSSSIILHQIPLMSRPHYKVWDMLYLTWQSAGLPRPVSSIMILSSLRLQYSFLNREQSWNSLDVSQWCTLQAPTSAEAATLRRLLRVRSGPTRLLRLIMAVQGMLSPQQGLGHWLTELLTPVPSWSRDIARVNKASPAIMGIKIQESHIDIDKPSISRISITIKWKKQHLTFHFHIK